MWRYCKDSLLIFGCCWNSRAISFSNVFYSICEICLEGKEFFIKLWVKEVLFKLKSIKIYVTSSPSFWELAAGGSV